MKIVADENIAQVAATFAAAGELVTMPGRSIDANAVKDADALLVRSVTNVDARLLEGSRCRFVGTATSGVDHVDMQWLEQQGIGFGWARGCNAWSVVDYVFSALARLSERDGFDWRVMSFGIVGCGAIGERLAGKLLELGFRFAIYDPFLDESHPLATHFTDFATVLQQDVVTFHTPLTKDGPWPTQHMLDARGLARLRTSTILINAARGGVVDNTALLAHLIAHPEQRVVLDAWENEPAILLPLLEHVDLGSAHIAGYSVEGKLRGTQMVAEAFNRHFGLQLALPNFPAVSANLFEIDRSAPALRQINNLLLQVYDVARDDRLLRQTANMPNPAAQFDLLRKNYPVRREFAQYWQPSALGPEVGKYASAFGFRPSPDGIKTGGNATGSA